MGRAVGMAAVHTLGKATALTLGALALLLPAPRDLAGQAQIDGVSLEADVMIEMRDGVSLATDIYRPTRNGQVISEPLPLLLQLLGLAAQLVGLTS